MLDPHAVQSRRTTRDQLRWAATAIGVSRGRVDEVLEEVGLGPVASGPIAALSLGVRQRLALGVFAAMICYLTLPVTQQRDLADLAVGEALSIGLIGVDLAALVLIVLAATSVGGEYAAGMMQTTLLLTPARGRMLAAGCAGAGCDGRWVDHRGLLPAGVPGIWGLGGVDACRGCWPMVVGGGCSARC